MNQPKTKPSGLIFKLVRWHQRIVRYAIFVKSVIGFELKLLIPYEIMCVHVKNFFSLGNNWFSNKKSIIPQEIIGFL